MSPISVPGVAKGRIGLLGSSNGRKGTETATKTQKNTRVPPRMATQDSRQLAMAIA